MTYIKGIDLSHWEKHVDFIKAKAAGAVFSYSKATQGLTYIDPTFAHNHAAAKEVGIYRGAFHFLTWVDGARQAEFYWSVIKADPGNLRIAVDFEHVPDQAEPPNAAEILWNCLQRLEQLSGQKPLIYTGLDFWINHGTKDPKWRAYPLWFAHPDPTPPVTIPAPFMDWVIWQYSWVGDGHEYGTEADGVDLNNTTPEKFATIVTDGVVPPPVEEEPKMTNAIGLYTETPVITNPEFQFIAGFAGKSWLETPANLKAIDEKAAAMKVPFFAWYKFNVDFYSRQQFMARDEFWPPEAQDEPLQKLLLVLKNRNVSGAIIEVHDHTNHDGKVEDPAYIAYASKVFVGRVWKWLQANKPNVKLIVASEWDWIVKYAPGVNDWIGKYNSCAIQKTTKPLVSSLPDPTDKPNFLDNRATCEFRRYWEMGGGSMALLEYRMGDRVALNSWLGFGETVPPTPDPDPDPTYATKADVHDLQAQIDALKTKMGTDRVKAVTVTIERGE